MKQFYSLSQNPGTTGEGYYRLFFAEKKLPYSYQALKCDDLITDVLRMKEIGASGFSVSMPYKTSVIALLDEEDHLVTEFKTCNTVVIKDGRLKGYNTDYQGMMFALSTMPRDGMVSILGDGSMGTMFKEVLGDRANVFSRRLGNWEKRHDITGTVINCTSFGTTTFDSPFEVLPQVTTVIDLGIRANDLKIQSECRGIKYITGRDFYRHQFMKQFEIYTGVPLCIEEIEKYD